MCCRHMVLHQMGDELDGPSPIYPCDGEAATGDALMLPATSDRNALRLTMGSPPLVDHAFFGDQRYALAQAPPISIARSLSLRRSVWRKASTACSRSEERRVGKGRRVRGWPMQG